MHQYLYRTRSSPQSGSLHAFTIVSTLVRRLPAVRGAEAAVQRLRPRQLTLSSLPVAVIVACAVALAVRLPYVLRAGFPLNDGGMFLAMSQDLLHAHFALPFFTSYNDAGIPFAYPPVSFYLVALSSTATGLPPLLFVQFLPLAANLASVVAVLLLARRLMPPATALMSTILFALLPRSYEWLIMGGGLTRSVGFLCALLCLGQAVQLSRTPSVKRTLGCGVLAALALASHLEMGIFVAYSVVLLALVYRRTPRSFMALAVVGLLMVSLSAPWWATVISRHGIAPFYAASLTGEWSTPADQLAALERFAANTRLAVSLIGAAAVLGCVLAIARGDLFLALWLPLVFLGTPRSALTEGTVPLGLLAGLGLCQVVLPGLSSALRGSREAAHLWRPCVGALRDPRLASVAAAATFALLFLSWPLLATDSHTLESLPIGDRATMGWVGQHTPPNDQFLVLSSTWSWEEDAPGEWFPALAGRRSVLTPQGDEWLPDAVHARAVCLFGKVRQLGAQGKSVTELDAWAADRGVPFSAIYVSKMDRGPIDWSTLIASAKQSPNYTVLLDTRGATVLQRYAPVQPRWPAGELTVARDCQSLAEQPADTQRAFEATYGPAAAEAWAAQHDAIATPRPAVAWALGRLGLAQAGSTANPVLTAGIAAPGGQ